MYTINDEKFKTAEDVAQYIIDYTDLSGDYDEMLDECYGDIDICGFSCCASLVLYRVDEVSYSCGYNEFLDGIYSDIVYDIERMSDGDTLTEYGFEVVYTEQGR